MSKGIRKDFSFKPEPMYGTCLFQINQVLKDTGWD